MSERTTGMVAIRATALEPIHHGAGIKGNTQLLRMQEFVDPRTGNHCRVPFISGNSLKHRIRYHAIKYALDAMGTEDMKFPTKAVTDLLFSGGALTKSGKGSIDLAAARRLEEIFPALSICGYSAGNHMQESKITVSHLHLVCAENAWRLPEDLREVALASARSNGLRATEFGTTVDTAGKSAVTRLLAADEVKRLTEAKAAKQQKRAKGGSKTKDSADKDDDSRQMIYDFQVVKAGTQWWGSVHFRELTDMELAALASAFHYASTGERDGDVLGHIAAKSHVGFGLMQIGLSGAVRATAAEYRESGILATGNEARQSRDVEYCEMLREHRAEIFERLREVTK